jgi:sigma-B regulation protein RsbU (phosphoserine phosphatase)
MLPFAANMATSIEGANTDTAPRLFAGVTDPRLMDLLDSCPIRDVKAGDVLARPGEVNRAIHLVLRGELRVMLGDDGFSIRPGESFGEMSVIDGGQVSAEVRAARDTVIVVIPEDVFLERIIVIPGVAKNVLHQMVRRLRRTTDSLLAEQRQRLLYERLQVEMQAAREIQSSMMPSRLKLFPGHAELDCAGAMFPAVDVAGDFFDACMISDNEMFFAVGDVSGKGVSAALFMAKTVPLLRLEATRHRAIPQIMASVNDALCENNHRCMFVTLGCGILNLETGFLAYGNAGHVPPVVLRAGGKARFLDVPDGLVLGTMEYMEYEQCETTLARGDLLLLYSDGVTEAFTEAQEAFGPQRLLDALEGKQLAGATEIVGKVKLAVDAFVSGAKQSDDIALFAVRYMGGGEQDIPGFTPISG